VDKAITLKHLLTKLKPFSIARTLLEQSILVGECYLIHDHKLDDQYIKLDDNEEPEPAMGDRY
jgi:hypothetical protein